jgi:hypothetical protein
VDPNPKITRKFWLDPNPKKSSCSDTDSDPDTVVENKLLLKIAEKNTEKHFVFLLENFFLCHTGSRTHMKAIRGTIWKNLGSKY